MFQSREDSIAVEKYFPPNSFESHDITVALRRHFTDRHGLSHACNMLCSWLQQQPNPGLAFILYQKTKDNYPTILKMDTILIAGVVDPL